VGKEDQEREMSSEEAKGWPCRGWDLPGHTGADGEARHTLTREAVLPHPCRQPRSGDGL